MPREIVVSAVVIRDPDGRVLVVRKRGTHRFMLVGGKPEPGETPGQAGVREAAEEVGLELREEDLTLLGTFTEDAANEPDHHVVGTVFEHPYVDGAAPRAEIEELTWLDVDTDRTDLAPLLRNAVLPRLRGELD